MIAHAMKRHVKKETALILALKVDCFDGFVNRISTTGFMITKTSRYNF